MTITEELRYVTVITGQNINNGGNQSTGPVNINIGTSSQNDQQQSARRQSYGHEQNRDIVGFHKEIETLLRHLYQDDETRIMAIAGMAGSGKTTLAKHLFHHDIKKLLVGSGDQIRLLGKYPLHRNDINERFLIRVWVCVSRAWSRKHILDQIYRQTFGTQPGSDEEFILTIVYENLKKESYLIILDDMWGVHAWNAIKPAIPLKEGSKVVITSRNQVVPRLVDPATLILQPQPLNPQESYELFHKRTFTDVDPISPQLRELGTKMVRRCRGLPLAITALSGVLRINKTLSHWERIRETLMPKILEMEDSTTEAMVKEILLWSYHDLPYDLKQCFLYLAIFPEDYEIQTGKLTKMWIAECLVGDKDPLVEMSEEVAMLTAEAYLDELSHRYMVIDVKRNCRGQVKAFQLHDLVREVCVNKAKEKGLFNGSHRFATNIHTNEPAQIYERLQLKASQNRSRLRSLIMMSKVPSGLIGNIERTLKFKLLRVLVLKVGDHPVFPLPGGIFELIHLRYLWLEGFFGIILPICIGNLKNLLTLDIRYSETQGLENLWRLRGLRHLRLGSSTIYYSEFRQGLRLDQLENLRTLLCLDGGDWMLSEMRGLSPTLHKLVIDYIRGQEELDAVFQCQSIMLGNLQTLKLDWKFSKAELKPQHMEALKQCENLWKMHLEGRIQERMGQPLVFPRSLVKLEIQDARLREKDLMDVLGSSLPCLKFLKLGIHAYMGTKLTCRAGSFPELERLEFISLVDLEHWTVDRGAMPSLKDLCFQFCPRLHDPPEGWRFVSNLKQVAVRAMPTRFEESLEQWREHHADLTIVWRKFVLDVS